MFLELSPGTLFRLVSRNTEEAAIFLLPHPHAHMISVASHVEKVKVEHLFGSHLEIGTCSRGLKLSGELDEEVSIERARGIDVYKGIE